MSKYKQLIDATRIEIAFGNRTILDFDKFVVYEGDKIGLVGGNGAGKTTLLRLLSGEQLPDSGNITRNGTCFYLKQFDTQWDAFSLDMTEAGNLGITDQMWEMSDSVSGGENTRIRLAQLFSTPSMLALLDEPSANLDRRGIEILENHLMHMDTFIMVSHDRALMNAVCNRIVELEDGKLTVYDGNYEQYKRLKEAANTRAEAEYEQYRSEQKRLQHIYQEKKEKARRVESKPRNMSSSEAKVISLTASRKPEVKAKNMERSAANVQQRMAHMEKKEKPREASGIQLDFRLTNPPRNPIVIRGEHVSFGYDGGKLLYDDATFYIPNQSKVALMGANGTGKSTLLHLLQQQSHGVSVVPGAKLGYQKQDFSDMDLEKTVWENISAVSIQSETITRGILARLLLRAEDLDKKVGNLSGGERMKLAFARLFVSDANILVLDEPTNYLDIPSLEALEKMLMEYEGTLLFVSHDISFVKAIATRVLEICDGKIIEKEMERIN